MTTLAVLEVAARVFWKWQYDVPLTRPADILNGFYPELTQVNWKYPEFDGNHDALDILLLGGSVLNPHWGAIEQDLRERLTFRLKRPVRTYNMAEAAHTSRDSYLKYSLLDRRFDLVIFYHGINETRANNAPESLFAKDYSHYSWYAAVNMLHEQHRESVFALPFTLKFLIIKAQEALRIVRYVPLHGPRRAWLKYGEHVKSAAALEENLRAIVELARERGQAVLLMTFATHVPQNYSRALFDARSLDYSLHLSPIEIWGRPEHVVRAIDRHNRVILDVEDRYDHALFVDQARLMPREGRYFNDICHFTRAGSIRFNDHLIDVIADNFGAKSHSERL